MEAEPVFDGARLFAQIAQDLSSQDGYGNTAQRVVELARKLTECDTAAIWSVNHAGQALVVAASDPAVGELQTQVNKERAGVVWTCLHEQTTVRIEDFRDDQRWPLYREWLESHDRPMISAAGYTLQVEDHIVAALVLRSRQPAHFTEYRMDVGGIFAEHAAISLQLAAVEDHAENLQQAMQSNRRIGIALGIVMGEYRVTDTAAFNMLRVVSQNQNRKPRDVAEDVALSGTLPDMRRLKMA